MTDSGMPSLHDSLAVLRRHIQGGRRPGRRRLVVILADYDRVCAELATERAYRTLGGTPPPSTTDWANGTLPAPPSAHDDTAPTLRRRSFTASGPYPGHHFTERD